MAPRGGDLPAEGPAARGTAPAPGPVVLMGAGETTAAGGAILEAALLRFPAPSPPRIAILETPAGFEPNSGAVAGRVADYIAKRLSPFRPVVTVVPARKRGTPFSPDDPALASEVLRSDLVFLGPGSPTYAARQLRGSRLWHAVEALHLLGGTTVLSSAGMVAAGREALPVYEIFKVGEELRWAEGLDFLGGHGLPLVLVPHWNNADGGRELDTRRCYLGEDRFAALLAMLPRGRTVLGVDEGTALLLDLSGRECEVAGGGTATVLRSGSGSVSVHRSRERFPLGELGPFLPRTGPGGIPPDLWEEALSLRSSPPAAASPAGGEGGMDESAARLLAERREARERKDWRMADALRSRLLEAGWRVTDTPDGQRAEPVAPSRPAGGKYPI